MQGRDQSVIEHIFDYCKEIKEELEQIGQDNACMWLYCNSDDFDDPEDFIEEDLLAHYGMLNNNLK